MEIVIRVAQFFLSLLILILLHELGHFVFARIFGVRVEKFYIFFNPWFSIWKKKIGDTEYGLGWLPLGGYVKIGGMIDESLDTDQMKQPPRPDDFRIKPAWQRLLIMSGGVIVNLLLAWVIYSGLLYTHGEQYLATDNIRYGIAVDSLGTRIGFESGDMIQLVNGERYENFNDALSAAMLTPDAVVTVSRQDSLVNVPIDRQHLDAILNGVPLFSMRIPMVIGDVAPKSAASEAGLMAGDSLLAINDHPMTFFDEFRQTVQAHKGQEIQVAVWRDDAPVEVNLTVPEEGIVGVYAVSDISRFFEISRKEYSLLESIPAGATAGYNRLASYCKSLRMMFVPEAKAHKSVGGFITIAKFFPGYWDWTYFWNFTAFLSIILAVMNFLPIPGLDGGHVLFLLYEMVTGRQPSERFMASAIMIGMLFLLFIVIYANLNDVIKLFQ